jgi:hypothetical protein
LARVLGKCGFKYIVTNSKVKEVVHLVNLPSKQGPSIVVWNASEYLLIVDDSVRIEHETDIANFAKFGIILHRAFIAIFVFCARNEAFLKTFAEGICLIVDEGVSISAFFALKLIVTLNAAFIALFANS